MITAAVTPDHASSALPEGPLPMRGAILTAIVNAFRLGDKVRTPPSGFSEGTAKRILQDDPAVSHEKRTALTRSLITHLFTIDYLRDRGLGQDEAHIHNEVLVSAIVDLLDRWESLVRVCNNVTLGKPSGELFLQVSGIGLDLTVRAAAYLCLHPRLHPVLESLEAWMSKPGLSGAFEELVHRARRISLDSLCRADRLHKNTIKALRDGKVSEPQSETLERLAHAFAKHGVARRHAEEKDSTAVEIEFELRVAAALCRVQELVSSEQRRVSLGHGLALMRYLRSELRRHTREELAELVVRGPQSPIWMSVRELIQRHAFAGVAEYTKAFAKTFAEQKKVFEKDPGVLATWLADAADAQAAYLRDAKAALGSEGGGLLEPLIQFEDDSARFMRHMADRFQGKESEPLQRSFADHLPAIEAVVATMNAITPYDPPPPEEKLRRLREAVAACPSLLPPRLMLVDELVALGRHDEALAYAYAAVGEHPERPLTRYNLALRLAALTRYAEALVELEEVDRRGGFGADAESLRGECLLELGRVEEAEKAFQRALEGNDRQASALHGLARCRRIAGDEREARKLERDATYYGKIDGWVAQMRRG